MKYIGDVLRETRLKKRLTLEQISLQTGVPEAYLLAMELNHFDVVPGEDGRPPLEIYASYLGLDLVALQEEEEKSLRKVSVSYPEVKEKSIVSEESDVSADVFSDEIDTNEEDVAYSYQSRRKRSASTETKSSPRLAVILLLVLASVILLFVAYFVKKEFSTKKVASTSTSSVVKTVTPSSKEEPKTSLEVTGEGTVLNAVLKNAKKPIAIEISLVDSQGAWLSVSNSDAAESGIVLGGDSPSQTITLTEGATSSVISLGSPQGLAIKVAGQELDLSKLQAGVGSTINLTVE